MFGAFVEDQKGLPLRHCQKKNKILRGVFQHAMLCAVFLAVLLILSDISSGGTYLSTAHGNSTSGVNRQAVTGLPYPDAVPYAVGHCGHCHEMHASVGGSEPTPPAAEGGGSLQLYSLFRSNYGANKNELCFACHETFTFAPQPLGYGRYGVYRGKTNYTVSAHNTNASTVWPSGSTPPVPYADAGNCHNCHNPHGYNDGTGVIPSMIFKREQLLCNECHDGSPVTKNVASLVTTKTYRHNVGGYTNLHKPGWSAGQETRAYLSANKHVECVDCHNPHEATAAKPTAAAPGVNPTNSASNWTAPSNYTETAVNTGATTTQEYMICLRCHSGYNTQLTTWNATWTDQGLEFSVSNASYHWVEGDRGAAKASATYGNFNIGTGTVSDARGTNWSLNNYAYKMMPRYNGYTNAQLRAVAMRCSDCHGPDNFDAATVANGPHGSTYAKILKVPTGSPFWRWDNTVNMTNRSNAWCFNCHDPSFTNSGFRGSEGELHVNKHYKTEAKCMSCHIKIPHGWQTQRLAKLYGLANSSPYQGTTSNSGISLQGGTWRASGTWQESSCEGPAGHQNCN